MTPKQIEQFKHLASKLSSLETSLGLQATNRINLEWALKSTRLYVVVTVEGGGTNRNIYLTPDMMQKVYLNLNQIVAEETTRLEEEIEKL